MASIKHSFNADAALIKSSTTSYMREVKQNLIKAADEMVRVAKKTTPPMGQKRGANIWTGALENSWRSHIVIEKDGTISVKLINTKPYASFVNDGHRMTKHFVPWLYIDKKNGLLSRYRPKSGDELFGIVVGTKTNYVPGANMVEKGEKRFDKMFEKLMNATNLKYLK